MITTKDLIAEEARAAEEAEAHTSADDPLPAGTKVTRGHSRTRTLQIRLNEDELEQLESRAAREEIPVSTMVRSMILKSLHHPRTGDASQDAATSILVGGPDLVFEQVEADIERAEADLDRVKLNVRELKKHLAPD